MKFSKKILSLFLVAMFALSACGGGDTGVAQPEAPVESEAAAPSEEAPDAEAPSEAEEPAPEAEAPAEDGTHFSELTQEELLALHEAVPPSGTITHGSQTILNPDFMQGFTNIATNAVAKDLMFYTLRLVDADINEEWFFNPALIKSDSVTDNADGSKTYTLELYDNHKFSDGTPITAKSFLFMYMLMSSAQFAEIDGNATLGINFLGYEDFNTGVTPYFSGLRLLGDYEMSITIDPAQLPYFYEIALFNSSHALPMHVIAPNADIVDNGNGCEFTGDFTVEVLQETILNPETGYRFKPSVVPGAYQFVSYDNTQNTAVIEVNPEFLCLSDGMRPRIQTIILKATTLETEMNELETGAVDIVKGVTSGANIDYCLDLADQGVLNYGNYPRNGYGYLAFHCDFGPTQFQAVRQAMCYMLDREEFGRQYSGGYAIVVDARYSESQWMYQEAKDILDERLTKYVLNLDKANELLDGDGWVLDENGNEYVPGEGKIRYKLVDGELMPLIIEWCSSNNDVAQLLQIMLPPAAESVGMKINETIYESVLDFYYRRNIDEPVYHMFNMGVTFAVPDAPWNSYEQDPRYWGPPNNQNYILSDSLYEYTQAMKKTEPGDNETFLKNWIEYVVAWNQELPDMPLYANIYYDFYQPRIQGYECAPTWSMANSLARAWVED